MARMVRKQLYIEVGHERMLRRIAERRGVSQAEVVRDAIERESVGSGGEATFDASAWKEALAHMRKVQRGSGRASKLRRWRRADLYENRVARNAKRAG
jgi:hypothetical protein